MKQKASFSWLLIPLVLYLAMGAVIFVERSGVKYEVKLTPLRFLEPSDAPAASAYSDPPVEALLLYDSLNPEERPIDQSMAETLTIMRVKYDRLDVNQADPQAYQNYKTVVLAFREIARMEDLHGLVDWVEQGGRVLFATPPDMTENFSAIYRKMGILSMQQRNFDALGVAFTSDLLPGSNGIRLEGTPAFLNNTGFPVQLEPDSRIHITSADEYALPLLWEKDYGQGRFVVINTDQFTTRVNRGVLGAAYSLLQDVFVYPVINSSVYFIDDFPAPIPEGDHPAVKGEFQRDVRSFLLNIWWPDMQRLADQYGLRYTGLLVETYNDKVQPPFDQDVSIDDHRYVGRLLLKKGGEIGLHGYNHVPLCLEKDQINHTFDYPDWTSVENGQMAVRVLDEFGRTLFPDKRFTVYVPPSNVLCPEARQWLPKVLPELKVISSLLLEDEGEETYIQNFEEAQDGIIEFPRVVSGYYLYEYSQLALLNELGLHYVNSHFLHPDDILDPERSEDRTWALMRSQIEQQVKWVVENAPGLRQMTADEAGMAVQRYHRLNVNAAFDQEVYAVHLGNFYDEAFMMMRTSREPLTISGGTITNVASNLYLIEANQPDLRIQFRK